MPGSISPLLDQREAVEREREHLDVDRRHLAGERDRLRRALHRQVGPVVGEREVRPQQRHPRGRDARRLALDEQRGALDPARRLGRPAERVGVVAELDREPRGGRGVLRATAPAGTRARAASIAASASSR